jgi:two-component system, cell cycle sensor histidine kinase and response regulator CckA
MERHDEGRTAIEILLVEDSPTDRMLTLHALEQARILNAVHSVDDGVEALHYLRKTGKFSHVVRPDLVLLDLNLPRKDGREVLAEIKADPLLRTIPVVIMTTSEDEADVVRAYQHYANGYVTKPLDIAGLARVICTLGNYWFKLVTLPDEAAVARHVLERSRPLLNASAAGPSEQPAVLLIEDSPTDAYLFIESLRGAPASFDVAHACSLADAEIFLARSRYDVVLTDLCLPESQGLDTIHRLQALAPNVPLVVLTGLDDDEVGLAALQHGAQDYLVKGELTGRSLARSIRYAIDKWRSHTQLLQAQRLEAIGQLAGGVAHDFNNVLGIVQGYATQIADGSCSDLPRAAAEVLHAVHHASRLTRQLLAFGRQQQVSMEVFDVGEVVAKFSGMLRQVLGPSVALELHQASRLPAVAGDPVMVEQVLLNLALNARDAMPTGGKLTIRTEPVSIGLHANQSARVRRPGQFVKLTVRDVGMGMSAAVLQRIWEPFFTTKDAARGSGLGLAAVHGIVAQHGGWIDVVSAPGKGTTFEVLLPAALRERERTPTPSEVAPHPTGSELLLVVEDNASLRHLARTILEAQSYRVIEAGDAEAALRAWDETKEPIALLLTDLTLPDGRTGLELALRLRRVRQDLPVVFVSGFGEEILHSKDAKALLEDGCQFVQKPYSNAALLSVVRVALDGRSVAEAAGA